jgi:predicted nucleic acid-binding protein
MLVIADTGPIISFSVIDKLDLLDQIFGQVVIPEAVWRELEQYSITLSIPKVLEYRNHVVAVTQPFPFVVKLGDGETEAMQLFREINADFLLVEDKKAREFAETHRISCIGTPGILELAKRKGLIPALRPLFIELLAKGRYFSLPLLNQILAVNGEALLP